MIGGGIGIEGSSAAAWAITRPIGSVMAAASAPLLSKLRRDQLLDYEWQESEAGPPRKYYKLAANGRKQLAEFREYWKSLTSLIDELGKPSCKQ